MFYSISYALPRSLKLGNSYLWDRTEQTNVEHFNITAGLSNKDDKRDKGWSVAVELNVFKNEVLFLQILAKCSLL